MPRLTRAIALTVSLGVALGWLGNSFAIATETPSVKSRGGVRNFARIPLTFEPNIGQAPKAVRFISRAGGGTLYLTPAAATFVVTRGHAPDYNAMVSGGNARTSGKLPAARPVVESHAMRIEFEGAHPGAIEGVDRRPGYTNFFVGSDPSKWQTRVPNFAKVRFHRIYRGIDLVFYGNERGFEYDFVLAPGASPQNIRLRVNGAEQAGIAPDGDLLIKFGGERLSLHKPIIYQEVNNQRRPVDGGYVRLAKFSYGIKLGKYDRTLPLVIDPSLVWASYAGGNFLDVPYRVATDPLSNPYITGLTCSGAFPEVTIGTPMGGCDGFVAKLDAATGNLDYFSIIGGSGFDNSLGIAVDQTGAAYIAGQTYSYDFPAPAGQDPSLTQKHGVFDAFAAKLDPNGNLAWSRLIGGSTPTGNFLGLGWSLAWSVAIPQGCSPGGTACNVYLAGQTTTTDFPTANAFQSTNLNYFTAFITELSPDGLSMPYSTYFGAEPGPNNDGQSTWAWSIAVDGTGKAYVLGGADVATVHTTLGPAYRGVRDVWIGMFDPSQSGTASRVWATMLGGSSRDDPGEIALGPHCTSPCATYLSGITNSNDLPVTSKAYLQAFGGGQVGFAGELDGAGNLLYLTYLGDGYGFNGQGISVDSSGSPYIVGNTSSPSFPLNESIQGPQKPLSILLKSTDGANTFGSVPIPVSASAVQGIAIDPSNSSNLYVGTTQNGLWKSTDGGATWSQITLKGQYARPAIDPNDSSIIYAATDGVMRSTDGGASFSTTSLTNNVVLSFAFDTGTNPSTVYASTEVDSAVPGSTGQVFRSTDGTNFTAVPGLSVATVSQVAFDSNMGAVYAATSVGPYVTSSFQPTGSMTIPREWMPGALLNDGHVLIPGGFQNFGTSPVPWASADLYDPLSGTFTATAGSMNTARGFFTATTLPSTLSVNANKVLIAGGYDGTNSLSSAELYDPISQTFASTGSMAYARTGHSATLLGNGSVLIVGNCCAELYDPIHEAFSPAGTMVTPRTGHTATLITSGANAGMVLITGGDADSDGSALSSAELWNPANGGSFSATGSMSYPRDLHISATLPSGRILIAGGETAHAPGAGVLQAEIYDPTAGTFHTAASLSVARPGGAAVALQSGKVIILSGNDGYQNFDNAEVYDESANRFTTVGPMITPRNAFPAVLLQNGNVMMAGANRGPTLDAEQTAELYDPNSFGFHPTGQHFSPSFAIAVDPTTNPSTIYASFLQGILRLNDGFWIDFIRTNPYDSIALDTSTTPATFYAGNGNGEIITSTDQGNDLKIQNLANFRPSNLFPIAASSTAPGLVYAGSFEQFDWFVYKLAPDFSAIQFSTYLGGSAGDFGQDVVVAPSGNAYVVGGTGSSDFLGVTNGTLTGNSNPVVAKLPNTFTGTNVTVQPDPATNVTYSSITSGGQTTATTDNSPPSLPPNLQLVSATDVTTSATYTASDAAPIVVCLRYDPSAVTNPNQLTLMHYQDGMWVNVTTSNDTTSGLICGAVTSLSPFAVVEGKPISVSILIKPPATAPASINLSSAGNIPVAILSSSTFDATTVNPSSILLDGDKVRLKGNGAYQCSSQDINGDGKLDLVCQVPTNQFQIIPGSDQAILTGVTTSNQYIQGSEAINIVNQ